MKSQAENHWSSSVIQLLSCANQLAALFEKPKKGRSYSRRIGCYYITVDVTFAGRNVRLFFTKRDKRGKWNGLITTNRKLDFFEAYRIYFRRWSLEVVFKESKQNLGLGKNARLPSLLTPPSRVVYKLFCNFAAKFHINTYLSWQDQSKRPPY